MLQSLNNEQTSLPANEKYYFGPSRLLTKRIRFKSNDGTLDFTINGGEQFQPIQVTSVVWNSPTYLQGMRPGDQILSINGIQLHNHINYNQVLQVCSSFASSFFDKILNVNEMCLDVIFSP